MTTKTTTPPDVLARLQAAWQTPVTPQCQPPASYVDRVIDAAGNIQRLDGDSDNPADQAEIKRRAIENAIKRSSLRDAALQAFCSGDRETKVVT